MITLYINKCTGRCVNCLSVLCCVPVGLTQSSWWPSTQRRTQWMERSYSRLANWIL